MIEEKEERLQQITKALRETYEKEQEKRNQAYRLEREKGVLSREKCRENVGRCFIGEIGEKIVYYMVSDINKGDWRYQGGRAIDYFNEFLYPCVSFDYPYNNSLNPFIEREIYDSAWKIKANPIRDIKYTEITKEEFIEKAKEIFNCWTDKIINN